MISEIFRKFSIWKNSTPSQNQEAAKTAETPEMRLHRRNSMLLELSGLMKNGNGSNSYARQDLLERLYHQFSDRDDSIDAVILKTIDVMTETAPEETANVLRMLAYYLTSYRKEDIDSAMNRELAQRCVHLAGRMPELGQNANILYTAAEFAPSAAPNAVEKFESLLRGQAEDGLFEFLDRKFDAKPGTNPVFEDSLALLM